MVQEVDVLMFAINDSVRSMLHRLDLY